MENFAVRDVETVALPDLLDVFVPFLLLTAACVLCLLSQLGKFLVDYNFPQQLQQDLCH